MPAGSIVAAFDIGSNSIKMTVGRQTASGEIEALVHQTETVRLSAGIDQTGELAADRIAAALKTLERMADVAREYGATRLIAVATEAVRIASNGPAFVAAVEERTGISLVTIDGQREAELTYLGLDPRIDRRGHVVLADIGGGSSEILVVEDDELVFATSTPLGSGRLTDAYIPSDPPRDEELATTRSAARDALSSLPLPRPADRLVVLGGTGEYLPPLLPAGFPITDREVSEVIQRLTTMSSADVAPLIGASQARARVLPAGVALVAALTDLIQPAEIYGAASGIRTGLLKAAFAGEWP